jgi:serine/threonine-protein kinase SRPK3
VALKVLAHKADRRELDILKRFQKLAAMDPFSSFVLRLIDHFEHSGPNGTHLCLVLELMWGDVAGLMEGYRDTELELRLPLVKHISRKLVCGLDALHSCGWIHNGIHLTIC